MTRTSFLFAAAALMLAGCSSVSVRRDYDPAADFSSLKTFAWSHETQPRTGNPRIDNDLVDARVRRAIEAHLEAKGFRLIDRDEADFRVEYFIGFRSRVTSSGGTVSMGMGRSSSGGRHGSLGVSSGSNVREVDEAALTIDFIDASNDRTIWRGVGSRRASSNSDQERITDRVNEAVERILKKFPPK